MKLSVIRIGNSRGLRLPKAVLVKYGIQDQVELELDRMIIRPVLPPREGWTEAFAKMDDPGDDELLMDDLLVAEKFDEGI